MTASGKGFIHRLRSFGQREDGLMVTELILTLPIFIFCIIAVYTYWDAYRVLNAAQKATYTVSDLLSRERRAIEEGYIEGLHDLTEYMLGDNLPVQMRVTAITYSGVRNRYEVIWSRSPNGEKPVLTTETLQAHTQHIPMLADGDSIVLVETDVQFKPAFAETPAFAMYLGEQVFKNFIVTRPRFLPRICIVDSPCA